MSGSSARLPAIEAVTTYHPVAAPVSFSNVSASELFGSNVFNKSAMNERLPKPVFKSLMKTIDTGSHLDQAIADTVASAMAAVRKTADMLEGIVADDLWPLATYQEMLFIM